MPHKLREKYLNSDFEANSKKINMKLALKRENIKKFVSLSFASLLSIGYCHAKWTTSFQKLKGLLEKKGEIELNPDALRSIDYPHLYRQHFDFDETLPTSPFPQWKGNTITRVSEGVCSPTEAYTCTTLTGTKFSFPGSMDEHKYGALHHYIGIVV